jgi:hypothetical protein
VQNCDRRVAFDYALQDVLVAGSEYDLRPFVFRLPTNLLAYESWLRWMKECLGLVNQYQRMEIGNQRD